MNAVLEKFHFEVLFLLHAYWHPETLLSDFSSIKCPQKLHCPSTPSPSEDLQWIPTPKPYSKQVGSLVFLLCLTRRTGPVVANQFGPLSIHISM